MPFDFGWLLWALPVAFGLGWLASRLDLRHWRLEGRRAPRAYFRGLQHLLNEQQDQAIDAFVEAVRHDPDAAELYFALGALFRRRGDYERAVRVHEHLLARADLGAAERERAQHALAHDFLKAGLLDRAEAAFRALLQTRFDTDARLALLHVYERGRDWTRAAEMAETLEGREHGSFRLRRAHHICEQAAALQRQQRHGEALALLEALVQRIPESPRAWVALAELRQALGQTEGALQALLALVRHAPSHVPLVAHPLAQTAAAAGRQREVRVQLQTWAEQHPPSVDVTQALAALEDELSAARQRYVEHLRHAPSLVAANLWLAGVPLGDPNVEPMVRQALQRACEPLKRYRCVACGFETQHYFWHCPGCQGWDTYPPRRVEEL
ncbi:Lipopolysaccharide assembly protein B [Tepidimonas alkaliphilus]|uniref:Lipopolysaccharide assembly protein B n=1 Tax=Tepidimonas alkaliphilus TaxID=2588942 RepID=A0A554W461_9BURK|nr:lipopolysaccharide assembly protein LapB [Tepidimonas alkaliphilus]TSE18353.1 Lipopolysaccharide assembly protein B [Tepidimonas alkaliphilus]